jgi:transcriptional regulator with PAS, ATPase and Fis domain
VTANTLSDIRPRGPRPRAIALELDGGRRIPVPPEGPLLIGTGPTADLALHDPYISTEHATLRVARRGLVVEDLGSKNGTWVDGVVVERAWAQLGTVLRFGRISMRVVSGQSRSGVREDPPDLQIVGDSPCFREALRTLERSARVRSPVLLRGETGTGKEVAARVVHRASERRSRPFVALNCGAIPESLAESELFGHVKGAFTGAHRDRQGAFARADGGTLLLDEVAELPLLIQAKLLRVLETGRVLPVGAEREQSIDVRIVSATHRNLEAMVEQGQLREDLYHRLGVLTVRLPPLRDRPGDIHPLLKHFARSASHELGYPLVFTKNAIAAAIRHTWPGNVRGLRNAVLRAGALADGPIGPEALIPTTIAFTHNAPADCVIIPRGDFVSMRRALVRRIIEDEGSIRRAAKVLGIARSTLGNWVRD